MTAKKFPTPNLDRFVKPDHIDHGALTAAAQADISFTVEAERVTVPKRIRDFLICRVSGYAWSDVDRDLAKQWLESLTVAPKDAPVEKRCGTCADLDDYDDESLTGHCNAPMPMAVEDQVRCRNEDGEECPCWKAKP